MLCYVMLLVGGVISQQQQQLCRNTLRTEWTTKQHKQATSKVNAKERIKMPKNGTEVENKYLLFQLFVDACLYFVD